MRRMCTSIGISPSGARPLSERIHFCGFDRLCVGPSLYVAYHHEIVRRRISTMNSAFIWNARSKSARSGLKAGGALRQARLDYGRVDQVEEECHDARGVQPIET